VPQKKWDLDLTVLPREKKGFYVLDGLGEVPGMETDWGLSANHQFHVFVLPFTIPSILNPLNVTMVGGEIR